ncbi:hypothetical protein V2G26_000996 [Clonostachys chloroleuca]
MKGSLHHYTTYIIKYQASTKQVISGSSLLVDISLPKTPWAQIPAIRYQRAYEKINHIFPRGRLPLASSRSTVMDACSYESGNADGRIAGNLSAGACYDITSKVGI